MPNPDPSPATRFGAPNGNTPAGGKSSAQRRAEIQAAEDSAILRAMMTKEMREMVAEDPSAIMALLKAETLKLFKDSEDRAHGQAEQTVHGTVTQITREIVNAPKPTD